MSTYRIYQFVRGETGLTDVKINIWNSSGTQVVSNASMTELGSTGIYYYDFSWTTAGTYIVKVTSDTLGFAATQTVQLGVQVTAYQPSTTVTYLDIKYDIGEAYNQIVGGTTSAIVNQLIGRAETDIKDITGTTTGYTQPIRYLADAYAVNQVLAGLGPESGVETKLINMRDYFMDLTKTSLKRKGKNFENMQPAWVQVNG